MLMLLYIGPKTASPPQQPSALSISPPASILLYSLHNKPRGLKRRKAKYRFTASAAPPAIIHIGSSLLRIYICIYFAIFNMQNHRLGQRRPTQTIFCLHFIRRASYIGHISMLLVAYKMQAYRKRPIHDDVRRETTHSETNAVNKHQRFCLTTFST